MTRTTRSNVFVLLALVGTALALLTAEVEAFKQQHSIALLTQQVIHVDFVATVRGGAAAIDVNIESSDEEESEDEEEEVLTKSTKKAANKAVKKSVAAAMKPRTKKKKSSLMSLFKIPYIVKACLNPAVLLPMVAGYWKSLYNIDYMSEKVSCFLSALVSIQSLEANTEPTSMRRSSLRRRNFLKNND